jgi:hypothetical protein
LKANWHAVAYKEQNDDHISHEFEMISPAHLVQPPLPIFSPCGQGHVAYSHWAKDSLMVARGLSTMDDPDLKVYMLL